ncbi:amino acid permease [Pseudomonas sp. TCU-HL1]|uniref:amino acid permease n=1 Tax=Pseudomonas sp. TCU-HL1 TaxID=1856685 RepID=UPI00083E5BE7|nr:amino acid permease [Pseudomonas sp. TCU-HL1]AOE88118.1 GABA permease [Pseudomonas sp. TCU-HL1]
MSIQENSGLAHSLKSRHVAMISFGGVIGAGLFVGSSAAILSAGPAVIVSYLLAGLVILMIMRMLGEMAVAKPGKGSFIEYTRLGLGHWAGFISGWLYWFFWVIVVGVEAIVATEILQAWIPAPAWVLNLILIGTMMLTNLMSVRAYGEFEFWFASLKVIAIILFAALCISYLSGLTGPGPSSLGNLVNHGGFFPKGWEALFAVIPAVIFSFTGSEVATVAAAESDDPARNVARAARTVTLRIMMFYVGSVLLIVCVLPWTSLKAGASPFVAVMDSMGIPGAGTMMTLIVLTAVLSCLNSGLYVTSRILFELTSHGDAPAALGKMSDRKVPARAILLGSLLGFAISMLTVISMEKAFTFLLNASGTLVLFIYILVAMAQIKSRRALDAQVGSQNDFKMWLFPWLSYATIAVILAVLAAMAYMPDQRSQVVMSGLSLAVVTACYFLFRRPALLKGKSDLEAKAS